ncbi:hypothetical protein K2173_006147 [Erythroxylum novogranatense]|uniref:F-box domain-containing protein n=1 Tax=Erythroxylum novogranatense TaxID=1862640 RepID=A0AAV8TC20_9ROSI|nr:hypothetical protein K2173_006147 [Erythroxylum novogranatense]
MGQTTSTVNDGARLLHPVAVSGEKWVNLADEIEISGDRDYTKEIPDECLASVFHFLAGSDRRHCSLVSKRWLRVEGQSRYRLSINAKAEIVSWIPSIFERFDSVTKLALRCDRKSISLNDDALMIIAVRCRNITRLKLRGCREITDLGMAALAQNCKSLKKLSCGSCTFGAKGMNAVLDHCTTLEELSIKRLRGIFEAAELISAGAASSSLKSICLKDLVNGQSFEPLVIGCENLKTLRISRCSGDWDRVLQTIGNGKRSLVEIHLEKLQVSDVGLLAISKCLNVEILHIVKTPECSNLGLVSVAQSCKQLRKLHIDGWRINRIGDEGLIAIAEHCLNLQELVLIGVNATHLSLMAIAANCRKLERLALCGSVSIGDSEIACIAAKCVALKKLCIKGCAISNVGIEALAWGCPNLVKVKVKKCKGVSSRVMDWLQERKASLIVNFDTACEMELLDASGSDVGGQESGMDFSMMREQVVIPDGRANSTWRLALSRAKLGFFASRNLVPCTFSRRSNDESSSSSNC